IPHPVLTLTLTGMLHGAIGMVVGWMIPGDGPSGGPAALWLMLPALATSAGTGALLGLVALAVQALIGPRSGVPAARAGESRCASADGPCSPRRRRGRCRCSAAATGSPPPP